MSWPLEEVERPLQFAFSLTISVGAESNRIVHTLWLDATTAILREGDAQRPGFELRSSGDSLVELDYVRQNCVVRCGEKPEVNRRAVIAHLAGPAGAAFDVSAGDPDWLQEPTPKGTRYRPRDSQAALREIVLGSDGLPVEVTTADTRVSWVPLPAPHETPPPPPDVSTWRIESYEFDRDVLVSGIAPQQIGGLPLTTTFAFRNSSMDAQHEYAIWERGRDAIHLIVGAPAGEPPTGHLRTAAVALPGERGVLGATSDELLRRAQASLAEAVKSRSAASESDIAGAREQRRELHDAWAKRIAARVSRSGELRG